MLVIRFQRTGRRNIPTFRLVVAEKGAPIKGKVQELLGIYLPARNPHVFECNKERIAHWMSMGAKPSDTVARLLKRDGIQNMEKYIQKYTKKKPRNTGEAEATAATEAKAPEQKTEGDNSEKKA